MFIIEVRHTSTDKFNSTNITKTIFSLNNVSNIRAIIKLVYLLSPEFIGTNFKKIKESIAPL